jgi:hypothetical protein
MFYLPHVSTSSAFEDHNKNQKPASLEGSGFPALKKLKTLARLLVAHKRTRR